MAEGGQFRNGNKMPTPRLVPSTVQPVAVRPSQSVVQPVAGTASRPVVQLVAGTPSQDVVQLAAVGGNRNLSDEDHGLPCLRMLRTGENKKPNTDVNVNKSSYNRRTIQPHANVSQINQWNIIPNNENMDLTLVNVPANEAILQIHDDSTGGLPRPSSSTFGNETINYRDMLIANGPYIPNDYFNLSLNHQPVNCYSNDNDATVGPQPSVPSVQRNMSYPTRVFYPPRNPPSIVLSDTEVFASADESFSANTSDYYHQPNQYRRNRLRYPMNQPSYYHEPRRYNSNTAADLLLSEAANSDYSTPPLNRSASSEIAVSTNSNGSASGWYIHARRHRPRRTARSLDQRSFELDEEYVERSKDKICGICLDVVVEKPIGERRFGILPKCSHIFCLECIRKWRGAGSFDTALVKCCPLCRVSSDFVCPSMVWVEELEAKEKMIEKYKSALSIKHCKYFKRGRGRCPFGNRCFYRHALWNGTDLDVGPPRPSTSHFPEYFEFEAELLEEASDESMTDEVNGEAVITLMQIILLESQEESGIPYAVAALEELAHLVCEPEFGPTELDYLF